MNYYPFYNMAPTGYASGATGGLFTRLFRGINFSSILNGTQKTINFMNQAIPMVKQISPLVKNTKTMFKVMNEFRKTDKKPAKQSNNVIKSENKNTDTNIEKESTSDSFSENSPTFFV